MWKGEGLLGVLISCAMAAADIEVAEFLKILEAHQKECERTGKYAEAAAAKKRFQNYSSFCERTFLVSLFSLEI